MYLCLVFCVFFFSFVYRQLNISLTPYGTAAKLCTHRGLFRDIFIVFITKTGISVFHDLKYFLFVYASPGHPTKGGKEESVILSFGVCGRLKIILLFMRSWAAWLAKTLVDDLAQTVSLLSYLCSLGVYSAATDSADQRT